MFNHRSDMFKWVLVATLAFGCSSAPTLAQSTDSVSTGTTTTAASGTPTIPPSIPYTGRQQYLRQQWMQNNPNWAQNHPQAAQYFQNHQLQAQRGIDRSDERQFGQNHPNFAQNRPGLAKADYKHPVWATNHPRRALGLGRFGR
ncbi:MAG TPA: hypothetical protein V6D22_03350 [Candidatus Obscuribacterales bacterium]